MTDPAIDRLIKDLHRVVNDVELTETTNTRNPGTDYNARQFLVRHGQTLLNLLATPPAQSTGPIVAWLINRGWEDAPRYELSFEGALYGTRKAFPVFAPAQPTHQHKKRGSKYVLIGYGKMQAEDWEERIYAARSGEDSHRSVDMREVAIYRDVSDNSLWVRPKGEFEDGRFIPLAPTGA